MTGQDKVMPKNDSSENGLLDAKQLFKDFVQFIKDLSGESDRASVVLAASAMDGLLQQTLLALLLPSAGSSDDLLEGDSPLSTFSARIRMAHRLGIIDGEFARALNLFRRIRNEFAHGTASISVDSQRDRIRELSKLVSCSAYNSVRRKFDEVNSGEKHQGLAKELRLISAFLFIRLQAALRYTERIDVRPTNLTFDLIEKQAQK